MSAFIRAGLIMSWHQHTVLSAAMRMRGISFWTVMIFLSEVTNWGSSKIGVEGGDILVYGIALLVIVLRAPKGIVGLIVSRSMERKR